MSRKLVKYFYICNGKVPECSGCERCQKECGHTANKNYAKYDISDYNRGWQKMQDGHLWEFYRPAVKAYKEAKCESQ